MAVSSGVFIILAIVLSVSRTGIICVLAILLFYIYCRYIQKNRRFKKLFWIIAVIGGLLFFFFLIYLKKDSASGRLLIWEVTFNMIKDNPVLGTGVGSFNSDYMLYQAVYFEDHPDSDSGILADNVLHPFNEFLLLAVEYGIIGLLLAIVGLFYIMRNAKNKLSPYYLTLLSILVFSCFSYPLKYPFVWVMFILSVAKLSNRNKAIFSFNCNSLITKIGYIPILVLSMIILFKDIRFEYKWKETVRLSSLGKIDSVIIDYGNLYSHWNKNSLFLYNYGAELNHIKDYPKSLDILHQCEKYFNDYDVQMLLADNYSNLNKFDESERHYQLALNMCPNRFLPLYQVMKIYDRRGQSGDAIRTAKIIINKEIKVPSTTVTKIKIDAQKRIES
ncbi:MAG: O-antigen ligase family protein, partial [Prevotella sp.]|nr:O-antigen ligase family protein [Prevotella sp.]